MKLYVVSIYDELEHNSGGVKRITGDYREAFDLAKVGEYIHSVETVDILKIVSGGKMAVAYEGD